MELNVKIWSRKTEISYFSVKHNWIISFIYNFASNDRQCNYTLSNCSLVLHASFTEKVIPVCTATSSIKKVNSRKNI